MQFEQLTAGTINLNGKVNIIAGAKVTQATIYAERAAVAQNGTVDGDPIGSVYIGTDGSTAVMYIRVAKAGAAADWYKVTATNA